MTQENQTAGMSQLEFEDIERTRSASLFNVDEFNQLSRQAQEAVGVNPDDCLTLLEVSGEEQTKFIPFFEGVMDHKFLIPSKGDWRRDDIANHVQYVRSMHPRLVGLAVDYASYGRDLINAGDRWAAKDVIEDLDLLLSGATSKDRISGILSKVSDPETLDMKSTVRQATELETLQLEHEKKIRDYVTRDAANTDIGSLALSSV
jgi:hypothetical protein